MINIFRKEDKVMIQPYRGYSSPQRLYLTGRILEDEQITSHREESFFQTLRNNYKIWESDEVAHVPVTLEIADQLHQTITDREGFFMFDEAEGIDPGEKEYWLKVLLKANFTYRRRQYQIANPAEVFLPDRAAQFGIISDIDDTVLHTDVLSRLRMLRNTFFYNPYRRKPLPGMSTWIRGLRNGADGEQKNPVFYVSKSPRNIFNYLATFLQINDFPKGPILLRDFGRTGLRPADYPGHKEDEIDRIFKTFPDLPFILIGDIAGRDAEIYHHFQEKYPAQVKGIYLRNIETKKRNQIFHAWKKDRITPNLLLMKDPLEGAEHSLRAGWIEKKIVGQIKKEFSARR